VLAWGYWEASRRSQYNRTAALRLCRQLRLGATVAAVLCGLASAGCSYQLHSLFSKDDPDVDQTGSISRPAGQAAAADTAVPSEGDLAYARAAASDVLSRGDKDASVPWQNPQTGAGGNITPLATAYSDGGVSCRDFLASYVHGQTQDWLQGAACRTDHGTWEVKSLRSLKSS
jgi:surface antigen